MVRTYSYKYLSKSTIRIIKATMNFHKNNLETSEISSIKVAYMESFDNIEY